MRVNIRTLRVCVDCCILSVSSFPYAVVQNTIKIGIDFVLDTSSRQNRTSFVFVLGLFVSLTLS